MQQRKRLLHVLAAGILFACQYYLNTQKRLPRGLFHLLRVVLKSSRGSGSSKHRRRNIFHGLPAGSGHIILQ